MRTYTLTPSEFAASKAKIARLNARAAKRGFPGRVEISGERVVIVNDGRRFPQLVPGAEVVMVEATIDGQPICYGGWRFLAALDALPAEGGRVNWVVRYAPDVAEGQIDREQLRAGYCEHCNTNRPNRRHLYAVQRIATGEVKQIGSTCIKDFLCWPTSPVFISIDDVEDQVPDGWGSSGPEAFTPKTLVTVALAAVEAAGWVPRSAVDGKRQPTAGLVADYLLDNREPGRKARELLDPYMDAATKRVAAVIETLAEAFADSTNDYESNLVAALTALSVEHRQFGLVCSAPSAYQRILNPPTPPAERPEPPVREWLGAIGDKVELTGTIRTARLVDGYAYNTTQMFLVIDAGPTLAKLYTAAQWAREDDIQPGATVTLAATVKAHDTYQGDKQTVLTRAKCLQRGTDVS